MLAYFSMPFQRAGSLRSLPSGSVMEFSADGNPIAVCNVAGEVHAVEGTCPHRGGPLAHGALHDNMLVCPWHAWEFDCTTGENDFNPVICVRKYAVKIEGDEILIDIP